MKRMIRGERQASRQIPDGLPKVCPCCGMNFTAVNFRVERGRLGRFFQRIQLPLFLVGAVVAFGVMIVFFIRNEQLGDWGMRGFGMTTWVFSVVMIPPVIEGIVLITPRVRRGYCLCGWKEDFPFPKTLWEKSRHD